MCITPTTIVNDGLHDTPFEIETIERSIGYLRSTKTAMSCGDAVASGLTTDTLHNA